MAYLYAHVYLYTGPTGLRVAVCMEQQASSDPFDFDVMDARWPCPTGPDVDQQRVVEF